MEQELAERPDIPTKSEKCAEFLRGILADEIITETEAKAIEEYLKNEDIDDQTYKQALNILDCTLSDIEEMKNQQLPGSYLCGLCDNTGTVNNENWFALNNEQIEHLIVGVVRKCNNTNKHIPDLIIYLINSYFERGYQSIHCHWDPKLIGEYLETCQCKKTVRNECFDYLHCNTAYCYFEFCGMDNQDIIIEFRIEHDFKFYVGIDSGQCDLYDCFMHSSGDYYAWCSEGFVVASDDRNQPESKFEDVDKYGGNDTLYMKISFLPNYEFGSLYCKKNENDWINTSYKIDKKKRFKIAASLYYDSELSLVSIKVKDNNDIDLYSKY